MSIKVDFHTHSVQSPDGALTEHDYRRMLDAGQLDVIAVTDHNGVSFALGLQKKLGNAIIVGEEITTTEGEIIGLYLTDRIEPGQTPKDTVRCIREQGGLVYIPHPFETVRKGFSAASLEKIANDVDVIEIHNGRAVFQNTARQTLAWAQKNGVAGAAASDAHGKYGWGSTYTVLQSIPSVDTLPDLLATAELVRGFPGIRGVAYPKFNRLRKKAGWRG